MGILPMFERAAHRGQEMRKQVTDWEGRSGKPWFLSV